MLVEFVGGPPGLPQFTQFVLHKFWDVTDYCPQQCLEWLATQVMRNKYAHAWTLQNMDLWVEPYLMAHSNIRVRNGRSSMYGVNNVFSVLIEKCVKVHFNLFMF